MPKQRLSQLVMDSSRPLMLGLGYTSRFINTSEGYFHAYSVRGTGSLPPIVILHGLGTHAAEMLPLLQPLRRMSRELIVPDLPQHGWSDTPHSGSEARAIHRMYCEGLDRLLNNQGPVIFFGNSLGGLITLRYYLHKPENVSLMVLNSPGGAAISESEITDLRQFFTRMDLQTPRELIKRFYHKPPLFSRLVANELQQRFSSPRLQSFMQHINADMNLSPEDLAQIEIPTLVVWGQQDRILVRQLDFFKQNMPGHVEFLEPEHYSHTPYLEHGRELAGVVRGFALRHLGRPLVNPLLPFTNLLAKQSRSA